MRNDRHNVHHIVPRSKNGSSIKDNLVRLPENVHNAFHLVFGNDTPSEQIERLLQMNGSALTAGYKSKVYKILDLQPQYIYKQGVLVPHR